MRLILDNLRYVMLLTFQAHIVIAVRHGNLYQHQNKMDPFENIESRETCDNS